MSAWEYVGKVPTASAGSRHSLWRGRRMVGGCGGRWVEGAVMSAGPGRAEQRWSQESQGSRAAITLAQAHTRHAAAACSQVSRPAAWSTSSRRPARVLPAAGRRPPTPPAVGCRSRGVAVWQRGWVSSSRVGCKRCPPGSCGSTPAPSSGSTRSPSSGSSALLHRQPPLPSASSSVGASTSSSGMSRT